MQDFTPVPALAGGALIGLAASIYLLTLGRVAGISGIYGSLVRREASDRRVKLFFLAGFLIAAVAVRIVHPEAYATTWSASIPVALVAGVLVGIGTQVGSGCTSGHGVCGISRLSMRSLVATITFMGTAALTVFVVRHVIGGSR